MNMHSRSALQNIFNTKLPDLQYMCTLVLLYNHAHHTGKKAYVCIRDRMDFVCCDRPQICTRFQFSRKCIKIIIVIMYFQLMYNFEVYNYMYVQTLTW